MPLGVRLLAHWQLKLLSLVFAVVLWIFVAAADRGEAVFTVRVDLTNVPPGMEVTAINAEAVEVRLQGFRHVLNRIEERELRAQVSVRNARPGDVMLRIRPGDVVVPRGLQVVRITPSVLRATLEPAGGGAPRPGAGG